MPAPLSQAIEDYLKAIYMIAQEERPVTTTHPAEHLDVAPASVTNMIKRLARLRLARLWLARHTPYHGVELRDRVPGAFQGTGRVTLGVVGTILAMTVLVRRTTGRAGDGPGARLLLAYLIALGIGLHNLGEGLAIGAAYALGEVALGTFLVLGFLLHNTTEGLGIAAPLAIDRPPLSQFILLGAVAGLPTIPGAWMGGFAYSPILSTLFLAIGAGAIFQVVYELARLTVRQAGDELMTAMNFAEFMTGLLIMYVTGLFVAG